MEEACHVNPYKVKHIEQKGIFDFADLANEFNWDNLGTMDVREISFEVLNSKLVVMVKYDFRVKNSQPAKVFKRNIDYIELIKKHAFPKAYNEKIPLSDKKTKDLKIMMEHCWIPKKYHNFYNEILK